MSTFTITDEPNLVNTRWGWKGVNLSAPLPLGYAMAIERAIELRNGDVKLSYPAIARIMREYHGLDYRACWWQRELKRTGRVSLDPRGRPYVPYNA